VVFANPVPQLDPNIKADFVYSPVGVVRVALNTAGSPEDQFIGSLSKTLLIATLLGGAVAIFLASILSARILQPVQALTRAALQMERGHLDQRVTVRTTDELGSLAHAFNAMADSVAHAERLRRTMLGDVAHDLRTPLTNIRGYLEAIQDGVVRLSPPVLRVLQDETLLLTRLVDDLQDLAQAEAGQVALECLPVDVVQTLEQAAAIVAPQAQARGVSINVEAPNALPPALADAGRVGQVLRNLLQNAITYTPDGGQVTLRARASECITVEVADTGAGIPPEHLPSVFERFYRVDPSRSRATGGSGLGLAIVRQLVEQQGGHVSVESIVGAGSTFRFTLPLAQASTGPQLARR
jgi:signal transduction histidine kinase